MGARSFWQRLRRRVRYWNESDERQRLLREEMAFHVDAMTQELTERGMPVRDARISARRRFGNMTLKAEDARATWMIRGLSELTQDLRHAFRGMRRNAGFTIIVILIAGLGIGASATVFSVLNALLLRPLPFHDPGRLVWISNDGGHGVEYTIQSDHYLDLHERNTSFAELAGWFGFYGVGDSELTGTGEPERLTSVPVTQSFFPLLGVEPALGRSFTVEECQGRFNAPPAVILSHGFWQRRLASDSAAVGRTLMLNNKQVTIVGVLPASFDFPSVFAPGTSVDLFIPWPLADQTKSHGNTTKVIGRLKAGVTLQNAQAEFTRLSTQIEREHPERNGIRPQLVPLSDHVSGRLRPALLVLAGAVAMVVLIVCANLSNLLLARIGTREREMAVRIALGAGRARLLRQMLTESIALSGLGATLGVALAFAGTRSLAGLNAFNLPLLASVRIDGPALGFVLVAAVLTGVLCGLLPALRARALGVQGGLNDGSRGSTGGPRHAWIRNSLVVSEIAFACILLVGAGLLMRSFVRALDVNLGFQPAHVSALRIDPSFRITSFPQQNAFIDDVLRRTRAVPGIQAAGLTDLLPLGGDRAWAVAGRGQVYARGQQPEAFIRVVTDGYFDAVGIELRAGRGFTEQDRASSEPVVVINETLARTLWPSQDALGQVIAQDNGRRVVGIVSDVRHQALEEPGGAELYLPLRQTSDYSVLNLVMRTSLPPDVLAAGIRTTLRPVDPNLPANDIRTLQALVDKAASPRRFLVLLVAGFACFALLLASLGIYGVISYAVNQRAQEIGIRMALGATSAGVQRDVLVQTLVLATAGLAVGLAAARGLATVLGSLLFGVTAADPITFSAAAVLLFVVAAVAGYLPARKASRIDPMIALRST
jgi:predicted permease